MDLPESTAVEPITLEEVYLQCAIDPDVDDDGNATFIGDPILKIMIQAAREAAEHYTGIVIGQRMPTSRIAAFPAAGGAITLDFWPVIGVVAITYMNKSGDEVGMDPTEYYLDTDVKPAVIRLQPDQSWPDDVSTSIARPIQIPYFVGYSSPGESPQDRPMPGGLKQAMLMMVAHWWKNRESVSDKEGYEVPMGAKFLMNPSRVRKGVA